MASQGNGETYCVSEGSSVGRGFGRTVESAMVGRMGFSAVPRHVGIDVSVEFLTSQHSLVASLPVIWFSMTRKLWFYRVGRHNSQESRSSRGNTKVGRLPLRECLIRSIGIPAFVEVPLEILLRSQSNRILVEPPLEAYLLISTPVLKSSSAGTGNASSAGLVYAY